MYWALTFGFRMGMILINAFPVCFDNILPYFRGGNSAMLRLRCVIAHKTLSSPRFQCENTAMGMPYFHDENLAEFCIWCAIAHRQGVAPIYTTRIDMLILRRAETPQSIKRVDACQCVSHTWGNHCHWVTRIGKITL